MQTLIQYGSQIISYQFSQILCTKKPNRKNILDTKESYFKFLCITSLIKKRVNFRKDLIGYSRVFSKAVLLQIRI